MSVDSPTDSAAEIAIVHDYLTQRGGAERVVLAMAEAFPGAPIYTSLYDADATFPEFGSLDVRPSALNRVGALRRNHRAALPMLAPVFSALRVPAEVVVCSSSGWAHGCRTNGVKIVYCHNTARWLYQADSYMRGSGRLAKLVARGLRPALLAWDRWAARSAAAYLTQGATVAERIRRAYGRQATCLPPPISIKTGDREEPAPGIAPGFWLCVSRLLSYKHVDAVVDAFAHLPEQRLVVVGDGPERARIEARAGANVTLLWQCDDAVLRWLYRTCAGGVIASEEDFGLFPLEALAFGKPTVALRYGGFVDTIVEGVTGLYFDAPLPDPIAEAVRRAADRDWDQRAMASHASRYTEAAFVDGLQSIVADVVAGRQR